MHLSYCVDLFSASNSFDEHVRSCVNNWVFKSTTEFHGWDDKLHLNVLFGALCCSYSLAGFIMLLLKPNWASKSNFPYFLFAYLLIFVQGPLSFSADYLNMTNDSIVHVVDRFMAVTNLTLQIWKITAISFYGRPKHFYCQLSAVTFAIFCFMNSQDAQEAQDMDGFVFWHNCWHIYPIVCICIEVTDFFYLGDCDASGKTSVQVKVQVQAQAPRKGNDWGSKFKSFQFKSPLIYLDPNYYSSTSDDHDGHRDRVMKKCT